MYLEQEQSRKVTFSEEIWAIEVQIETPEIFFERTDAHHGDAKCLQIHI